MKKIIIFFIFILFAVSGLFAQSLQYNQYYKQSLEYTKLSEQAFDNGEYDLSIEHSLKAQEFAALSKQYIDEQVLAFRAKSTLNAAKDRMALADRLNIKNRDSELYNSAAQFYKDANSNYNAKDYANSLANSQKVLDLLKDIAPAERAGDLAAFYKVKLNADKRDCLWRIAGFDYIYGDPFQWKAIYDANKDSFPRPDDPNLIHPGMILKIPSIKGESRSGER